MLMPNGPAATVGLALSARAGVHTPVSACASGAEALALALDLLRSGRADVVVAGGAESCVHPLPMAGFAQMRALSTRHDEPEAASRPYDKGRDGFVLGEGAGILVLETEEHARSRGATVHAPLSRSRPGLGRAPRDRAGPVRLAALRAASRWPFATPGSARATSGSINAHATSTPLGDVAEAAAFASASATHRPPVTATKSCTGHLLGAAGAVEALATVLTVRDGVVPADPQPRRPGRRGLPRPRAHHPARARRTQAALSTSFGFGGHDVSLVVTR